MHGEHATFVPKPQRPNILKNELYWFSPFPHLPRHLYSMKPIFKNATRLYQGAEDWFWRFVFIAVVCDFLYLAWWLFKSRSGQ